MTVLSVLEPDMPLASHLAANRANWDERADLHFADETGFYRIAELLAGANLLLPIEREELGDLDGRSVAHLQCHIGTDTLSLRRQGAGVIAGLDFSGRAIAHARELARRTGIDARFEQGVVYDAAQILGTGYDRVFTSWGTLVWMDDLERWARAVAGLLKPGGVFHYVDCHPTAWMLAPDADGNLKLAFDYETAADRPLPVEVVANYNLSKRPLANRQTYEWSHSLSSILNALIGAGLTIEHIGEHEALQWGIGDGMTQGSDHLWRLPPGHVRVPLALTIRARK